MNGGRFDLRIGLLRVVVHAQEYPGFPAKMLRGKDDGAGMFVSRRQVVGVLTIWKYDDGACNKGPAKPGRSTVPAKTLLGKYYE